MKLVTPLEALAVKMAWVRGSFGPYVRLLAASEVAGALGLVLPSDTRVLPVLTPVAAAGLAVVMVLAAFTHAAYGEWPNIGANVVLAGLALLVARGRFCKARSAHR